jgi:Zn-dependent protease
MSNYFKQFSLIQLLSIPFTFLIYSVFINWKVAAVLMIGIGFHEMSHLWAARRLGLKTGGLIFIPFVGGLAFLQEGTKSRGDQAFVAIMGPAGGALLAAATMGVYFLTGYPLIGAAASWMIYINLFNLLPLSILDGGQLLDTVTYSINRTLGLVIKTISTIVAMIFLIKINYSIAIVVGFLAIPALLVEMKNWNQFRLKRLYMVDQGYLFPQTAQSLLGMLVTVFSWLGLAAGLFLMKKVMGHYPDVDVMSLFKK